MSLCQIREGEIADKTLKKTPMKKTGNNFLYSYKKTRQIATYKSQSGDKEFNVTLWTQRDSKDDDRGFIVTLWDDGNIFLKMA